MAKIPQPDRSKAHARINHDFTFDDLHYDIPENYMPCIKVCSFFRKRPDVSDAHFHKHYAHVHADIVASATAFGALKVLRYSQFHQFPRDSGRLRALGRNVLDYDGCSTTWFRSWEDAETFWQSKELRAMFEDCKHFMEVPEGGPASMAGQDMLVFGHATPGIDVRDGITGDNWGQKNTKMKKTEEGGSAEVTGPNL